jgi:hypothetical protein
MAVRLAIPVVLTRSISQEVRSNQPVHAAYVCSFVWGAVHVHCTCIRLYTDIYMLE